jgi:hypothetical protein
MTTTVAWHKLRKQFKRRDFHQPFNSLIIIIAIMRSWHLIFYANLACLQHSPFVKMPVTSYTLNGDRFRQKNLLFATRAVIADIWARIDVAAT